MGRMNTNIILFLKAGVSQLRECGYTGPSIELMSSLKCFLCYSILL